MSNILSGVLNLVPAVLGAIGNPDENPVPDEAAEKLSQFALMANAMGRFVQGQATLETDPEAWRRMKKETARERMLGAIEALKRDTHTFVDLVSTSFDPANAAQIMATSVKSAGQQAGLLADMAVTIAEDSATDVSPETRAFGERMQRAAQAEIAGFFELFGSVPDMDNCSRFITEAVPVTFTEYIGGLDVLSSASNAQLDFAAVCNFRGGAATAPIVFTTSCDRVVVWPSIMGAVPPVAGGFGGIGWSFPNYQGLNQNGYSWAPNAAVMQLFADESEFMGALSRAAQRTAELPELTFNGKMAVKGKIVGDSNFGGQWPFNDLGPELALAGTWSLKEVDGTVLEKRFGGWKVLLPSADIPKLEHSELSFRLRGTSTLYAPTQFDAIGQNVSGTPASANWAPIRSYIVAMEMPGQFGDVTRLFGSAANEYTGIVRGVWSVDYKLADVSYATGIPSASRLPTDGAIGTYTADVSSISFTTNTNNAVIFVEFLDVTQPCHTALNTGVGMSNTPCYGWFPCFSQPSSWVAGIKPDIAAPAPDQRFPRTNKLVKQSFRGDWTAIVRLAQTVPNGVQLFGAELVKRDALSTDVYVPPLTYKLSKMYGNFYANFGRFSLNKVTDAIINGKRVSYDIFFVGSVDHFLIDKLPPIAIWDSFFKAYQQALEKSNQAIEYITPADLILGHFDVGLLGKDGLPLSKIQFVHAMKNFNMNNDVWAATR